MVDLLSNSIQVTNQGFCSNEMNYELGLWLAPMLFAVLWNLVFYIMIARQVYIVLNAVSESSNVKSDRTKTKVALKFASFLLIFIFCWIIDVWNHIQEYYIGTCPNEALMVLQNLTTPLQGFLNAVVYGLSTRKLRKAFLDLLFCKKPSASNEISSTEDTNLSA